MYSCSFTITVTHYPSCSSLCSHVVCWPECEGRCRWWNSDTDLFHHGKHRWAMKLQLSPAAETRTGWHHFDIYPGRALIGPRSRGEVSHYRRLFWYLPPPDLRSALCSSELLLTNTVLLYCTSLCGEFKAKTRVRPRTNHFDAKNIFLFNVLGSYQVKRFHIIFFFLGGQPEVALCMWWCIVLL